MPGALGCTTIIYLAHPLAFQSLGHHHDIGLCELRATPRQARELNLCD